MSEQKHKLLDLEFVGVYEDGAKLTQRDCKHGRLKRRCQECDSESEVAELKAENERLRIALMELEKLVKGALSGDS